MTRFLARLADLAYRRRGRMVLAWIAGAIVIIGVGSALKGENNADYNTPGSDSKAAADITKQRFGGYSGQEIYVVWKDTAGARSPAAQKRLTPSSPRRNGSTTSRRTPPIRVSKDGNIGASTLPMTKPGWDFHKSDGEKLIAAANRNSGDGLRSSSAGTRSTPPRARPAPRESASSAPRSSC